MLSAYQHALDLMVSLSNHEVAAPMFPPAHVENR
jgi:hypothetical protein